MSALLLGSPQAREDVYRTINPAQAKENQALLRVMFVHEMELRKSAPDTDYFENLYWCAFLLYCIGDLGDVRLMWEAKHINMDTGVGFDVENLVGAGVSETIAFLEEEGHADIADYLKLCREGGDFSLEALKAWEESRLRYFAE